MKKMNLLAVSLISIFLLTGQNLLAQDVDLTHLIVNNDFEYIAEGVPKTGTAAWKPKDATLNLGYTRFYGWECDLAALSGSSQGINQDFNGMHGAHGAWISNTGADNSIHFPNPWEFYQIIDKDLLDAGTYKVQCLLSGTKMPTSQRLFANQNVQYCLSEENYALNQTEGEIATFAGYPIPTADADLSEMVVYTTIGDNDSLKIGIRTGSIRGDGTVNPKIQWGWFKVDYFRLTKIDPNNASLNAVAANTLSYTVDNGLLTVEGADAYTVYSISGRKTAEVKNNIPARPVNLTPGIYVVKTDTGAALKVIVN
jgi:hypothetical protein